jgi:hypothetical protein
LRPGYCPGHRSMLPTNALQNATTGINTAEDRMGVAKLVYPEEMYGYSHYPFLEALHALMSH